LAFRDYLRVNSYNANKHIRKFHSKFKDSWSNNQRPSSVISYGPCQFPTLNFVVERAEKIQNFKSEDFYSLELTISKNNDEGKINLVNFNWERDRLFDKDIVKTLYEKTLSQKSEKEAIITNISKNPKIKYRPIPLNTVEMQKLVSRKLKISSHVTMDVAEKLYQKGYISYPRTETQKYANSQIPYLKRILNDLGRGTGYEWCDYAKKISEEKFFRPRDGKLDDKSHPPIHPVKFVESESLTPIEKKIYELIVIYFLATVSHNAEGEETFINLSIGEEKFYTKGLNLNKKGYLEIYPYETVAEKIIPEFKLNESFKIFGEKKTEQLKENQCNLNIKEGKTTPPFNITEAELISLMDKHGIGTDSTIHEHIKHIQERGYAQQVSSFFKPTEAGNALVKAYQKIGVELYKPHLRAAMEKEMREVADGKKEYQKTFIDLKKEMKKIYDIVFKNIPAMTEFLKHYLKIDEKKLKQNKKSSDENISEDNQSQSNDKIKNTLDIDCPGCNQHKLKLIINRNKDNYFIGCSGYPKCRFTASIKNPISVTKIEKPCEECGGQIFEMKYEESSKIDDEVKCMSECLVHELKDSNKKGKNIDNRGSSRDFKKSTRERSPNKKSYDNKKKSDDNNNTSKNDNQSLTKKNQNKSVELQPDEKTRLKNKSTRSDSKQSSINQVCPICKVEGRHPKNSSCTGVKKKKSKIENGEFLV
jgi:DNA topoisomerase IA